MGEVNVELLWISCTTVTTNPQQIEVMELGL